MSSAADTAGDVRIRMRSALARSTARLGAAGIDSASVDARALIGRAAGTEEHLLLVEHLPEDFDQRLEELLARREARVPLQLIIGYTEFRRVRVRLRPGVFVPRPETELIIDHLLDFAADQRVDHVIDLCTGSGAIASAALDELPHARISAVELDDAAADLAATNLASVAEADGKRPPRHRVLCADVADASLPARLGTADAVLSNPPYIPADAVPIDPEVHRHDPPRALYGGGRSGLELPRSVLEQAVRLLRPGGLLVMEHADVQGAATRELAQQVGDLERISTARDLTGRDRFLVARRAAHPDRHTGNERLPL